MPARLTALTAFLGLLADFGSFIFGHGGASRFRPDIAGSAMKVRTVFGVQDLEARRNAANGRYVGVVALRQASHPPLAAVGALQLFVPQIGLRHGRDT
jgi:hypothetical protein